MKGLHLGDVTAQQLMGGCRHQGSAKYHVQPAIHHEGCGYKAQFDYLRVAKQLPYVCHKPGIDARTGQTVAPRPCCSSSVFFERPLSVQTGRTHPTTTGVAAGRERLLRRGALLAHTVRLSSEYPAASLL
jgi:hypothetical protein